MKSWWLEKHSTRKNSLSGRFFLWRIKRSFFNEKMHQIETETDKNSKTSDFPRFYAKFVKLARDFADHNVKNAQKMDESVVQ